MRRLDGKVAVVTGGAGRIGRATALRLSREGASVVVADLADEAAGRVAADLDGPAIGIGFDAADVGSVERMVAAAVDRFGALDVLVNNHAFQGPEMMAEDRTVLDTSFELWDRTMAVNLRGFFATCKYAVPHLIARGGGSIVNMASGAGLAGDDARIAYGTSKAAIIGFSRYIATQHGRHGIRSNCLAPGLVADPELLATIAGFAGIVASHTLTPRLGVPDDVAAMVAFLASDETGYVTGQCFPIDGGLLSHQPFTADLRAAGSAGKLTG